MIEAAVVQLAPAVFPPQLSYTGDPIGVEAHLEQGAIVADPLIPERGA